MKYLEIGLEQDRLQLSRLVLGTDYFGTTVTEETAFRLLDIFTDAGGNCIDTARVYASWLPGGEGASEKTIGKWLKSKGCRNKIILSTKGGHPPLQQMSQGRLSRAEIEADLDRSLTAMGIDTVDLYWLHRDDSIHPVEDIMDTLSRLVAKGKVRAVGCSNWKTGRIEAANRAAGQISASTGRRGTAPFIASQIQWSLAGSTPEAHDDTTLVCMNESEYKWYEKEQFPVFAFSSQAKGFFARAAAKGFDALNQKSMKRFFNEKNISCLERVKEYSAQSGYTPTAVALGYLLCNRVPAAAIVGCKNEEQLRDSLTAADVTLPESVTDWLLTGNGR